MSLIHHGYISTLSEYTSIVARQPMSKLRLRTPFPVTATPRHSHTRLNSELFWRDNEVFPASPATRTWDVIVWLYEFVGAWFCCLSYSAHCVMQINIEVRDPGDRASGAVNQLGTEFFSLRIDSDRLCLFSALRDNVLPRFLMGRISLRESANVECEIEYYKKSLYGKGAPS